MLAAKAAPGLMYPGTRVVPAFRPDYSQVSIVANGKLEGARLQPCRKAAVLMGASHAYLTARLKPCPFKAHCLQIATLMNNSDLGPRRASTFHSCHPERRE
jgi:hypothetical protein